MPVGTAIQTNYGKAFEYSCLKALEAAAAPSRQVAIVGNTSLNVAKAKWEQAPDEIKSKMALAADAGVKALIKLEPRILEKGDDVLELSLQADSTGIEGDVRDILIIRSSISWEIGVSVKHNHTAAKHSRLSQSIDFGKEWFGVPCSLEYFERIRPLFAELGEQRDMGKQWSELPNKSDDIYKPLLTAFKEELMRINGESAESVTGKLLEYLLGRHDFYKIISQDRSRSTILQCINIHGTLNQTGITSAPELRAGRTRLPSKVYHFDFKKTGKSESSTTLELVMDEGWAVSFRIHNASSRIETSLKFDIQISGVPSSLFSQHQQWQNA